MKALSVFFLLLLLLSSSIVVLSATLPQHTTVSYSLSSVSNQSPEPIGITAYVPILISNPPAYPGVIPAGSEINLGVNWKNFTVYVNKNVSNVQFFDSNFSSTIPGWLESCSIDGQVQDRCTNSSDSSTVWVKIDQAIPTDGNISINLAFYNVTENLFSASGNWGEAPNLTSIYGQYDNGANVFHAYYNFAGTSLPQGLSEYGSGTVSVDNGLILEPSVKSEYVGVIAPITPIETGMVIETSTTPASVYCQAPPHPCTRNSALVNENSFSTFLGYGTNSSSTRPQYGYSSEFWADDNFQAYFFKWSNYTGNCPPCGFNILSSGEDDVAPGLSYLTRVEWTPPGQFSYDLRLFDYNGASVVANDSTYSLSQVNQTAISAAGSGGNTTYVVHWVRERSFIANNGMLDPTTEKYGKLATSQKVTFSETGLSSGTKWSITFDGKNFASTTTKIIIANLIPVNYSWTTSYVLSGTSIRFSPSLFSGMMNVSKTTSQGISFTKQYKVIFKIAPSGSDGKTSPSGTVWINAGASVSISATANKGFVFSKWVSSTTSIKISSKSSSSTTAKINAPGKITAKFVP